MDSCGWTGIVENCGISTAAAAEAVLKVKSPYPLLTLAAYFIKDLEELSNSVPKVHREFCNGNFVIHNTPRRFSVLPVDQAYEQNNVITKGSGGAIGLTEDPTSLRRWSLAGPEVWRMLNEFMLPESGEGDYIPHHEQYRAFQKMFREETCALKESFLEYRNPFLANS
ncbi:hypothetical protein PR048_023431 [Dryococelus australis]|uniref:Uncharacterized protein n=1 Tax=Dryococelus australis TaxID=614101 RepID=A0ABQ9GU23_9NEOP|nr:hypothetical protein PR048_023431 [Dryococelus australis]